MNSDDNQLPLPKPPTVSRKYVEDIDGIRSASNSFQSFSLNYFRKVLGKLLNWNKKFLARFQQPIKEIQMVVNQIEAKFQTVSQK